MVYRYRTIACFVSAVCAMPLLMCACSKNSMFSLVPYKPVITFAGIVGPDSLYLPGNRQYPNTCAFDADTVRMYFYSENYSQGPTSSGDQMRIDVLSADSEFITNRHARLHFTRYDYYQNTSTYEITPADTFFDYNKLSMRVVMFGRRGGDSVFLSNITASARPLGPYSAGYLSIVRGVIQGTME